MAILYAQVFPVLFAKGRLNRLWFSNCPALVALLQEFS